MKQNIAWIIAVVFVAVLLFVVTHPQQMAALYEFLRALQ